MEETIRPETIPAPEGITHKKTIPEHISTMQVAALMGEMLLYNGAEIYRVQDTLTRVITACGYPNHSVYVLSNGVFITINEGQEDACSSVRYVPIGSVNLEKISRINQISRNLCNGYIDKNMAYAGLSELKDKINYKDSMVALAYAFGSAGFGIILGGSLYDSLMAFFIGLGLFYVLKVVSKYGHISRFPSNIIGALYCTLAAAMFASGPLPVSFDKIVIGSIMPLVPGYALTTSIRDIFNGDFLSGLIHLLDAVSIAVCIAVGVGVGIVFIKQLGGGFIY